MSSPFFTVSMGMLVDPPPSPQDLPMAVGSTGMLATSNYAARKFGVRAAMPGFIARKASVADPDPPDPYVFGPPGSGS